MGRSESIGSTEHITATQACKRCHARKRRCDRRQPRCGACVEADVTCEQELRASEKTLLSQLNESQNRVSTLSDRVEWLQGLIVKHLPAYGQIRVLETGHPGETCPQPSPKLTPGTIPANVDSPSSLRPIPSVTYTSLILGKIDNAIDPSDNQYLSAAQHPLLPTLQHGLETIRSFLVEFKQTHAAVDEDEVESDMRAVYGENGLVSPDLSVSRFRAFGLLYINMLSTIVPSEEKSRQTCRRLMMRELQHVLAKESIVAVQALALLGIIAISEPGGPNLFQICGLAARTAISIRLHRKDDVYLPLLPASEDAGVLFKHNEHRKNIFWAVYSLDRLSMHVSGQPPAIRDSDIDVDLPTIPPHLPGIVNDPTIALRVHNVRQRRLYGVIQDTFYGVNVKPVSPLEERERLVANYVREIQDWYDTNPLKTAFIPMSTATVARQCLDDISYHQMILALHRPSRLIPDISSSFVAILLNSAGISVDLYRHYWKSKQVLINWIHLYQIFTSCITLVYCFCEYRNRPDLIAVDPDSVNKRIAQCRELLVEFGPTWPESPQYQMMFDLLVTSFQAQVQPPAVPAPTQQMETHVPAPTPAMGDTSIAELLNSLTEQSEAHQPVDGSWTPNEVMRAFGIGGQ